jgi:predicted transposase/invertase (TIGR01784 family)
MKPKQKEDSPHHLQDLGYKEFFSFIKLFEQLIQGFIDGSWKAFLDYEKAERIEKSFVLPRFKKTEADILYRVPLLSDPKKSIHLYILIEHQSSVDQKMAFRVLCYLVEIWKYVLKNTPKKERDSANYKLPPLLPIVLYNGKEKWTAKTKLKDMVDGAEFFKKFTPNVEYHLVDVPRLNEEKLEKLKNSLSAVFLLERPATYEELEERLEKAFQFLECEENEEIVKLVLDWFVCNLKVHLPEEEAEKFYKQWLKKNKKSEELKNMLETTLEKIKLDGVQQGKEEGALEELRNKIIRVLQKRKLGKIPTDLKDRLKLLSEKKALDELFDLALTATTIKEFEKQIPK